MTTIAPEVDPNEKTIWSTSITNPSPALKAGGEVFFCRISSGKRYDPVTGEVVDTYATPAGTLLTYWKIVEEYDCRERRLGYSTPAVPGAPLSPRAESPFTARSGNNAFGERRSHGCVNVTPEDAKWIFRWSMPFVSLGAGEERRELPDHGTIVNSTETQFKVQPNRSINGYFKHHRMARPAGRAGDPFLSPCVFCWSPLTWATSAGSQPAAALRAKNPAVG